MAGGISLPAALQLLDGQPHRKIMTAFADNVPFAKVLSGGDMGKLLPKVLADGNLTSVLANPMAALTGQLQAQVGQAAQQVQAALGSGGSGLVSALTGGSGLGAALSMFQAAGDNLAGLTNGQAGLFALAGHDSLLGMLGEAAPEALAAARVLGPVASGAVLGGIAEALPGLVQSVIAGATSIEAAVGWVEAQIAGLLAIVQNSADALAQGQAVQMLASTVATVSGLITNPPGVPLSPIQVALATLVLPEAQAAMDAALAAQIRATAHGLIDVPGLTSLG